MRFDAVAEVEADFFEDGIVGESVPAALGEFELDEVNELISAVREALPDLEGLRGEHFAAASVSETGAEKLWLEVL